VEICPCMNKYAFETEVVRDLTLCLRPYGCNYSKQRGLNAFLYGSKTVIYLLAQLLKIKYLLSRGSLCTSSESSLGLFGVVPPV